MKKLLVIGKTFPEPSTTAAGGRMLSLLHFFKQDGYQITFTSSAKLSEHSADLESLGIQQQKIQMNDSSFDQLLTEIAPSIVLYDRYHTEEQFGWRVRENAPQALTILDTEDLHFLRKARENAIKNQVDFTLNMLLTEEAKREIASIWRCDVSLIISTYEMSLLKQFFKIPGPKLFYLPITVSKVQIAEMHALEKQERVDFITAGNFYHAPNLDAVIYLKEKIWPLIRKALPKVKLNIYGAYAPQKVQEFHKPSEGFLVHGWAEDLDLAYRQSKICLAPLRFGAGLKGKLIQAMLTQTPVVTTDIGAEGMYSDSEIPGIIANSPEEIANAAISLYREEKTMKPEIFSNILEQGFLEDDFYASFRRTIESYSDKLNHHRQTYFFGEILHHQSLQSTKYMSKWIEEKNKD